MESHPHSHTTNRSFYRPATIGPILFLAAIFFLTFIARVVLAPLMPGIEKDMGIDHAQAGTLFLFLSAGYFISLFGSGFVSSKIRHKNTIALSVAGTGAALMAVAFSRHMEEMSMSVFFLGLSAGLYLPSGISALTAMVDSKDWGKALSIHELAPNLGFVAAPVLVETVLLAFPWRAVPAGIGLVAILAGMAWTFSTTSGNFAGTPPDFSYMKRFLTDRRFRKMIALFGLGIGSTVGIYSMLPLYLTTEIGIPRQAANYWIAISRAAGLVSALASGWAADRFGPGRTMGVLLCLAGIATIGLGISSHPVTAVSMVFVQALLSTGFFPPAFAVLSAIGSPEDRNLAVSFTIPFAFMFGAGVVPAVIGICGDAGAFGSGIASVGALIATGGFLALRTRRSGDHPS